MSDPGTTVLEGNCVPNEDSSSFPKDVEDQVSEAERPSISEIIPGVFLGNAFSCFDRATLRDNNITSVLSLLDYRWGLWQTLPFVEYVKNDRHKYIACKDSTTQDLLVHMTKMCDFIDQMLLPTPVAPARRPPQRKSPRSPQPKCLDSNTGSSTECRPESGAILVHCEMGISRSATAVIAYMMRKRRRTLDDVLQEVQKKRPRVKPNPSFMAQLLIWEKTEYQVWLEEEPTVAKPEYAAFLQKRAARLAAKGKTGNEPLLVWDDL
jgi:dual specificity phosphatase 12